MFGTKGLGWLLYDLYSLAGSGRGVYGAQLDAQD
jgi:hypothetical protein